MPAGQLRTVLEYLHAMVREETSVTMPDGDLLNQFIRQQDETAFETLVRRHGPMVLAVCRRVLRNPADAEDAFQATFLLLVRKASTLRSPGTVANWLYGVAHRTALDMRKSGTRRRAKEAEVMPRTEPAEDRSPDWRAHLDRELARLPDRYRAAVVLCDLQGKTRREAARELGCAEGTVASRLARGRALLAARLSRRGIGLSAGALTAMLAADTASAGVPGSLLSATVQAAGLVVAGKALAAVVSARVAAAVQGALKTAAVTKFQALTIMVLMVGVGLSTARLL